METVNDEPFLLTEPEIKGDVDETNDGAESGKIDGRSNVLEGCVCVLKVRPSDGR